MKKILTIAILLFLPGFSQAQDIYQIGDDVNMSRQFIDIPAMILILYLVLMFILTIMKSILDNRLKSQMIEKGVTDKVAEQFLQPTKNDSRGMALKWFLILMGIGVGLTIIDYTLPIGIHSIAIMSFSLAFSFLGYFYFIKKSDQ